MSYHGSHIYALYTQYHSYRYSLVTVRTAATAAMPPQRSCSSCNPHAVAAPTVMGSAVRSAQRCTAMHSIKAQSLCTQSSVDHSQCAASQSTGKGYSWWMESSLILSIAMSQVCIKRPSEAIECHLSLYHLHLPLRSLLS
jgi:hypothetical protein